MTNLKKVIIDCGIKEDNYDRLFNVFGERLSELFIQKIQDSPQFKEMIKLRKELPDHVWDSYRAANSKLPELIDLKTMEEKVRLFWNELYRTYKKELKFNGIKIPKEESILGGRKSKKSNFKDSSSHGHV